MKLEVDRKALLDAVKYVGRTVPRVTSRPILVCVLLEAEGEVLRARTYDMEIATQIAIEKVEIAEPGKALVPAARLRQILSGVTDERLMLETNGQALIIKSGRGKFKLLGDKPDDFPAPPDKNEDCFGLEIAAAKFMLACDRVLFAAATERTRYALNGIWLKFDKDGLTLVATDGRRLAVTHCKQEGCQEADGIIVPMKAIGMICDMPRSEGETTFRLDIQGNDIVAWTESASVHCRLIEGHFPDWQAVMPKDNDRLLRIERDKFKQALIEGALMTDRESMAVRFALARDKLTLSSRSLDAGEGHIEINVDYKHEPLEIAFNPAYLLDMLKITGDIIGMRFKDSASAALLTDGSDYRYVVMPVSTG